MENNWEPRVGQKVVCILNHRKGVVVVGDQATITGLKKCGCGMQLIDIGLKVGPHGEMHNQCGTWLSDKGGPFWLGKILFAPIPEQYADMTAEIAQQFKEHPDTVEQPVKVLETSN